jgi:hypothetical protein
MEVTLRELQQMLIDGKISTEQFSSIMMEHMGQEAFIKSMQDVLKETYGKDILTKELPPSIKETFGV